MTGPELLSGLAVLVSLYAIISNRRYVAAQTKSNLSEADSNNVRDALALKEQYKTDLKDLRDQLAAVKLELEKERVNSKAEFTAEHDHRHEVEDALEKARIVIAELQRCDHEREMAMEELNLAFKRDVVLRQNVERALEIASVRITELEKEKTEMASRLAESMQRLSSLEDELDKSQKQVTDLKAYQAAHP